MKHFAQINSDNIVISVIVAEQDFIDSLQDSDRWIETSPKTRGGVNRDDGTALRKNYAGIGFTYDADRDAFIPPCGFESWTLNETTCLWEAPSEYPTDGQNYHWDEETTSWTTE